MAYTTIDDPSAHFTQTQYTGNGSSGLSITNNANAGNFQPDLLIISPMSNGDNCVFWDSSRGSDKRLKSNSDAAEDSDGTALVTFESDGFDLDTTDANFNGSSRTYISWQWKMNAGSTTSGGGDDSIATSTYQANTTAKQSIVTYTGEASAKTVAHGLGVKPNVIIVKCRQTKDWHAYFDASPSVSDPETDYLRPNTNLALTDNDTSWNDTAPTTSVFTIGSGSGGDANGNTDTFVAYCFASVQGYSKFGSYEGNYNTDGTFIWCGFKPAWVTVKECDNTNDWDIRDAARNPYNPVDNWLRFNTTDGEGDSDGIDFLSNGFKIRQASNRTNRNGTLVYMAFAEQPFVTSGGVPCTAR